MFVTKAEIHKKNHYVCFDIVQKECNCFSKCAYLKNIHE